MRKTPEGNRTLDEARDLYGKALTVFEEALGAEHPHTRVCREAARV